ncbi:MAG: ABC transporter substrate-binding protein [Anaerolineales bacterium]|nr:ABC transporter substrate-binding protein [Anaerolineales bacterium]
MNPRRMASLLIALGLVAGCAAPGTAPSGPQAVAPSDRRTYGDVIIGFSQLGAESEWRVANTNSIKDTAAELGLELRFSDAQQKQDSQIEAVRKFIVQKVDLIGLSPIVETGWDEVFEEARAAGIPIILVDRRADVPEDLYTTYLGSDFLEEGRNAARALVEVVGSQAEIVELVGTLDSAPANDRFRGFREVLREYPDLHILDSESGDFTRARGREVMDEFLRRHGARITAVYAHNDDMAVGAIEAITAYGLRPGVDIKIVSVDATRSAFEAMLAGTLNATVECNPLLGPQFFELALKVINGEAVPKWVPSHEQVFFPDDAEDILPTRGY